MMGECKDIETAPKDGTFILGVVVIDGVMFCRTTTWVNTPKSKYNPDGGFWTCPNRKGIIGPFTHWFPNPTIQGI